MRHDGLPIVGEAESGDGTVGLAADAKGLRVGVAEIEPLNFTVPGANENVIFVGRGGERIRSEVGTAEQAR